MDFAAAETNVRYAIDWLRLVVEAAGAAAIAVGVVMSLVALARHAIGRSERGFTDVRLLLARYLTLALELQLAADILSTSVAPTWDRIGKLAVIAVIRTALNYFLEREMRSERAETGRT